MYKKLFVIAVVLAVAFATEASPADRVIAKVDQLIAKSVNEQAEHNKIHAANEAKCAHEKKFRTEQIDQGKTAYQESQAQLQACTNSLEVSQRALAETKSVIKATKLEIVTAKNQRAIRAKLFQKRKAELEANIQAINEAYDIIGEFKNGKAALTTKFVQLADRVNTMFLQSIEYGSTTEFGPLAMTMAQIMAGPTVASLKDLRNLVQLFRNLEASTKSTLARLTKLDEEDEVRTNALLKLKNSELKNLIALRTEQVNYIAEMEGCVTTETKVSALAAEKVKRNTQILENTVKMCAAFQQQYITARTALEAHIKLLKELKAVIVKAVNGYSYGLYTASGFSELEEVESPTEFIQKAKKVVGQKLQAF